MFTGLIEFMGRMQSVKPSPAGVRLVVDASGWTHRPGVGESISINGCCLTLATEAGSDGPGTLAFDVVPETLAKTTLGTLEAGTLVHMEASATPTTLLGGHIVQGHVDGVGEVEWVRTQGEWRARVRVPETIAEFLTPKGSIAVEGVSLTLAAVGIEPGGGWFEIALIPTTLAKTTLGELKTGSRVNLEADAMAKTVVHWIKHFSQRAAH